MILCFEDHLSVQPMLAGTVLANTAHLKNTVETFRGLLDVIILIAELANMIKLHEIPSDFAISSIACAEIEALYPKTTGLI